MRTVFSIQTGIFWYNKKRDMPVDYCWYFFFSGRKYSIRLGFEIRFVKADVSEEQECVTGAREREREFVSQNISKKQERNV